MAARHRTNSLAFAKSDCHTCSELKRWCDRQRPQCGTCIKHRRKCGGYVLDLTWKQPSGNSPGRGSVPPSPGLAVASERRFKFKQGRPKKKRKVQKPTDNENSVVDHARTPGPSLSRDEVNVRPLRPSPQQEIVEEPGVLLPLREQDTENPGDAWIQAEGSVSEVRSPITAFEIQNWPSTPSWIANDENLWQDPLEAAGSFAGLSPGPLFSNSPDQFGNPFSFDIGNATDATSSTDSPDSEILSDIEHLSQTGDPNLSLQLFQGSRNHLSYGVLYNNTHHKFSPVLSLYDEEFCVIPLTMDCTANPFRVRQECVQGSQYLLHAILALSMQHLAKKSQDEALAQEMQVHRSAATHLFSEALSKSDALVLLDTLLILVNLDVTRTCWGKISFLLLTLS